MLINVLVGGVQQGGELPIIKQKMKVKDVVHREIHRLVITYRNELVHRGCGDVSLDVNPVRSILSEKHVEVLLRVTSKPLLVNGSHMISAEDDVQGLL